MKNTTYEAPEALIVSLEELDVITTSIPTFEDGDVITDGWIPA